MLPSALNGDQDKIFVIGLHRPDTDSATSSVAYAALLNQIQRYPRPAEGVIPGPLTPQSKWVFQQSRLPEPRQVTSLAPVVGDICSRNIASLNHQQTLGHASDLLIRSGHAMVPIIDDENRLVGVFSNRDDSGSLLMGFDVAPLISSLLRWSDIVSIPGLTVHGDLPDDEPCGNLHILLAGSDLTSAVFQPNDVVICAGIQWLHDGDHRLQLKRLIQINATHQSHEIIHQHQPRPCLLNFSGTVSELLRQLNRCVPLCRLHFPTGACLGPEDTVEDIAPLVRVARRALPVVDENGTLCGLVSRNDLTCIPKRGVVVIDHFETSQLAVGCHNLEILEIIDHHRVGDIQTMNPVRVDCRPIGSSCSIVALNYFECGINPDAAIALLLLGGLCADTLALTSPTTTESDRQVADRLTKIAAVDFQEFSLAVLKAGDDLHYAPPSEIWNRDQKIFTVRNHRFAVAQLETVALDELPQERLRTFKEYLETHFSSTDLLCSLLLITDVVRGTSLMTACESPALQGCCSQLFRHLPSTTQVKDRTTEGHPAPDWWLAPGIVSRKKQVIPSLMKHLSEFRSGT